MSDTITEISLADAVEFIVDNRGKTAPTEKHGIPLIATNCVSNEHLFPLKENLRYVSQETYENWFRSHLIPGDILLTNKGSQNGAICLVPDPADFCIAQDMVGLRADKKKIYPLYLFAVLRSNLAQNRIKMLNVDSVIPHFKKTDFDKLYFPLPGKEEQKLIGDLYFNISFKMYLNCQINQTLEAMARAIFKSWFVDFDPVRAKAEARDTGLPKYVADLFPDSFEDSELGEVPKGWKVGTIGDLADVSSGKRPDVRYLDASVEARIPLWGGNGPMAFVAKPLVDYPVLLTGRVGTLGSVFRITKPCWPSDNTLVLKTENIVAFEYLFIQLKHIDFKSLNRGSTQPLLTQTDLKSQPVILPTLPVLELFHRTAKNLYTKIDESEEESRTLTELRDTLLPKLISGELRVKDTQKIMDCVYDG